MATESVTTFSARLRLPEGHSAAPVLDGPARLPAPAACSIAALSVGEYSLQLGQLAACGVRECQEQGEAWLCLLLRFPILSGTG
jgi:hypothetical protein